MNLLYQSHGIMRGLFLRNATNIFFYIPDFVFPDQALQFVLQFLEILDNRKLLYLDNLWEHVQKLKTPFFLNRVLINIDTNNSYQTNNNDNKNINTCIIVIS